MSGSPRSGDWHERRVPARRTPVDRDSGPDEGPCRLRRRGRIRCGRSRARGIRPGTVKRHLADLRARSGLTTEQLIYVGRAEGWLTVASLEALLAHRGDPLSLRPKAYGTPTRP